MDTEPAAPIVVAFCDSETISLRNDQCAAQHPIWEVALIRRVYQGAEATQETTHVWQIPADLAHADPISLTISGYYARRWPNLDDPDVVAHADGSYSMLAMEAAKGYPDANPDKPYIVPRQYMSHFATTFAKLTHGAHFIGACGMFDANRLEPLLRHHSACPGWHYQVHDIEGIAAGWFFHRAAHGVIAEEPLLLPFSSDRLAEMLDVSIAPDARHTALGDARMVADMWDIMTSHQADTHGR